MSPSTATSFEKEYNWQLNLLSLWFCSKFPVYDLQWPQFMPSVPPSPPPAQGTKCNDSKKSKGHEFNREMLKRKPPIVACGDRKGGKAAGCFQHNHLITRTKNSTMSHTLKTILCCRHFIGCGYTLQGLLSRVHIRIAVIWDLQRLVFGFQACPLPWYGFLPFYVAAKPFL